MPCRKSFQIDTSKPVVVTGATGYLAGVLISQLLDEGLTVHGTVRDPGQTGRLQYLVDLAASSKKGTLKLFAGDLLQPGSFDAAARGCAVIFHTASPFFQNAKDPYKELVEPAVQGTENVLTTANNTPSVQRVVLTSSCAAIYGNATDAEAWPNKIFTEECWNRSSSVEENAYRLGKTLAEQKAWVMAASQSQWRLVVCNPGAIMGPGIKYHTSSVSYNTLYKLGGGPLKAGTPNFPMALVDVRDVAAGHVSAAFTPDATGRHILVGHSTNLVEMGQAIAKKYPPPTYPVANRAAAVPAFLLWLLAPYIGITRTFVWENLNYSMTFDNSKAQTKLGMEFYSMEDTMQEMYQQYLDHKMATKDSVSLTK